MMRAAHHRSICYIVHKSIQNQSPVFHSQTSRRHRADKELERNYTTQNTRCQHILSHAVQNTGSSVPTTSFESEEWCAFGECVSGEWDGVSATFDADGQARELPEYYVPQAYRDWDVQLYDWQCQCSMLCNGEGMTSVTRKLMPTVGCEADAVAFTEDTKKGSNGEWENSVISAQGLATRGPGSVLLNENVFECTAEHIITLEDDMRIRMVHLLKKMGAERQWRVQGIEVYVEKRDGPYTGRRELAGCGGGMNPFATSNPLSLESLMTFTADTAKATGVRYSNGVREEVCDEPWGFLDNVDAKSFIGLPKNCWTTYTCETSADGDTHVVIRLQVGVLSEDGSSMTAIQQVSVDGSLSHADLLTIVGRS